VAEPIQIPLSQSGPPAAFAAALAAHCAALAAHRVGKVGVPVPAASALLDSLIERVPATGPVATRGPDTFRVRPYVVTDDTPKTPEVATALSVLRETLK
jgi:hypothetical protein